MKRFFLILTILVLSFSFAPYSYAQEAAPAVDGALNVDQAQLNNFIETLESDEKREEFIANLKLLAETSGDTTEEQVFSFASLLGVDQHLLALKVKYKEVLEKYDLNSSMFNNLIATGLITLLALFFMWVNHRLSIKIRNRLISIKDRFNLSHDRLNTYIRILRFFGHIVILLIAALLIGINWGMDPQSSAILALVNFKTLFSIILVILIGIIVWEFIDGSIEYMQVHSTDDKQARMNTLAPIIRNIALVVFMTMFSLILLSELGINVLPLLAGAGILGIAIGFGAQAMVKDFISGFFIIFEDLIQVGDVANLAGHTGVIERLTIRKAQLRDFQGNVYTVPYGEITTITNMTKDFSFYVFDMGVAYREDTDKVIEAMKEVDEVMRADPEYKDFILEPLEVVGVDSFGDSAVVIKARVKTLPVKQWFVGRGYNRMFKYKFDELNIEIPFPHQTIYFGQDHKGKAPALHIEQVEKKKK